MHSVNIDIKPIENIYPYKSNWININGINLHYLNEGPQEAPTVVMLHGNPTWSFYYRNIIPAVAKKYRVIVPDHIGCGLSDKPQNYPYTLDQHIITLELLVSKLELNNLTLVMHDWGGLIGMGYAIRHPENISRFVVLNSAAFYLPHIPLTLKIARSPIIGDVIVRGFNGFSKLALIWAIKKRERLTPQVKTGYLIPYNNWFNRIGILRFIQDIPLERGHISRKTLLEIDNKLGIFHNYPMLILWGGEDFVFTQQHFLMEWQKRFPKAQVHIFKDAGHYILEDAYEYITPLILDFLEQPLSYTK
jgi:haloalkane dehalogenase